VNTYILKDPIHDNDVSKITNFSKQWSKYYPHVKISLYALEFKDDDIIIVNLNKGNPYGNHNIPEGCKKIFIVHSLDKDNIKFLYDADFIIYLNDIQRQVAQDISGIMTPSLTAPRHPMHVFNTEVKQENTLFIGGWFFPERTEKLFDRIAQLNKKLPTDIDFTFYPAWGKSTKLKESIDNFYNIIQENIFKYSPRKLFTNNNELFYDSMIFKTRVAKHAFLWDDSPTIEEIKDLLSSNDEKILNYSISESSMLSILQASPKKLIVENRIKFLTHFEVKQVYTYQQFSGLVKEAISALS